MDQAATAPAWAPSIGDRPLSAGASLLARDGHDRAFAVIVDRYQHQLSAYARRLTVSMPRASSNSRFWTRLPRSGREPRSAISACCWGGGPNHLARRRDLEQDRTHVI